MRSLKMALCFAVCAAFPVAAKTVAVMVGPHAVKIDKDCHIQTVDGFGVSRTSAGTGNLNYLLNDGSLVEVETFPNRQACKVYIDDFEKLVFVSEVDDSER